jgi:hypothetical protein
LKAYKRKEKDMVALICTLKDLGYPVQEAIENVATRSKGRTSDPPQPPPDNPTDSETDLEPIVTGPPKAVQKPDAVPLLDFDKIEPESDSTSQYTSSTVMSTH